ncbi:TIGR01440 family protein [Gracilibacillus timonensis]|uniref:TIGR01440 family protein n=1 Tax=Gracilibacillus timonensis TaxID=1816696 RepID=UPI000824CF62|nr:TIGR01440 family protein [Gracilibacillus timonensis]
MQLEQWQTEVRTMVDEWISLDFLTAGDLFVIGCSTSEVVGEHIGTAGSEEVAAMLYDAFKHLQDITGVHLCFQCCEHLNRAVVVTKQLAQERNLTQVSVQPVRHAGGSMAAYAYQHLPEAVVVEALQADAGIDIGETMIGMHLKPVAVPLRLTQRYVGQARTTHARTRPKLIGGPRAVYPVSP